MARVLNMRDKQNGQGGVRVDRKTRWGNPFKIGVHGTREQVIAMYEAWIQTRPDLIAALPTLRGHNLSCWCRPSEGFQGRVLCHAQILAGLANGVPPESFD